MDGALEYKVAPVTAVKADDAGSGSFTGYASLWDRLDLQGDIVARGAFKDTLPQWLERGFIAWAHAWDSPIALVRDAVEDATGLLITADFHSDEFSQRARIITSERLKRGKFMGLSIGYRVPDGGAEHGESARILHKIDLYETSLVTVPALPDAGVTSAKADGLAEGKPFPNFHACRVRDPADFQADSFRQQERTHEGKPYRAILGKLKGASTMTTQALRYPRTHWSPEEARAHCRAHDGQRFEPADAAAANLDAYLAVLDPDTRAAAVAALCAEATPAPGAQAGRLRPALRYEFECLRELVSG